MTAGLLGHPLGGKRPAVATPFVFVRLQNRNERGGHGVPPLQIIVGAFAFPAVVFTLLMNFAAPRALCQGFSVQSKSEAQSVVGAGRFVSLEGRFSIALPPRIQAFRGMAIDTPMGRATGDAYDWSMREGKFSAGYVESPQPLDTADARKQMVASARNNLLATAQSLGGKLQGETELRSGEHAGSEIRMEFPKGVFVTRFFLVPRRLFVVSAVVQTGQQFYEALAMGVLDSFKILSAAEVRAANDEKAAKAEPGPLPQEPVVPKVRSDAEDEGLHGAVRTVFIESEDLTGTWSVQGRKSSSTDYYNPAGNLTRENFYDYKGNLSDITVFGYLDGARVIQRGRIEHEYNPPPMMIASTPGEAKPKYDPRYSNKYVYQYDNNKRLVKKLTFGNDGKLRNRNVYKYSANQREVLSYSEDGSLNNRSVFILDDKGNTAEWTNFNPRDGSVRTKNSYAYEFDAKGNWIKQTTSKWVTKEGKSYYQPEYVSYRRIEYYR